MNPLLTLRETKEYRNAKREQKCKERIYIYIYIIYIYIYIYIYKYKYIYIYKKKFGICFSQSHQINQCK